MSAPPFVSASLHYNLSLLCLLSCAPQGIPPEAYKAKTIFIRNNAGGASLENAADEELSKWGRFTLADDEASADIILVFSKNGVQNTEKSDNKKDAPAARRVTAPASHPGRQCAPI
jgi:hypothetical protein